jgi:outer membrane protein assembly factor BamB
VSAPAAAVAATPVNWGPAPPWTEHRSVFEGPGLPGMPVVAWSVQLGAPVTHALSHDGQTVYAVAGGTLSAIGLDGSLRWSERVAASGPASPTSRGPAVGTEPGPVAILDAERGTLVARFTGGGPVRGQPVEVDGGLVWVTVHGLATGERGFVVEEAVSVAGGATSGGQRATFSTLEGDVYAIGDDGVQWRSSVPGAGVGHPVMDGSQVFLAFAGRDGRGGAVALRAGDGVPAWTWQGPFEPSAPPALGPLLVLGGKDGRLVALSPQTGELVWEHTGAASISVTPALCDGSAYIGTGAGTVQRIDLDDGGLAWEVDVGAAVTGDPVVVAGLVVVGLVDCRVVALRAAP